MNTKKEYALSEVVILDVDNRDIITASSSPNINELPNMTPDD